MTRIKSSPLLKSQTRNSEAIITTLLAEQNRQAIDMIYQNYGAALYGIIIRIVKSEKKSEEILQDVFVKIWLNSKKYELQKGRLFTWLASIARNCAIDHQRSARNIKEQKTTSWNNTLVHSKKNISKPTYYDFALKNIIQSLDKKYSFLIQLTYFQGYSQRDIEKETNIPLGTVKSRLRKAIHQLQIILQRDKDNGLL